MILYFLQNNIPLSKVEIFIDPYIPLQITFDRRSSYSSEETYYISSSEKNSLTEIKLGDTFGEVYKIVCTQPYEVIFTNQSAPTLRTIYQTKALCLSTSSEGNKYIKFKAKPTMHVYKDYIDIDLFENLHQAYFQFQESAVHTLTDQNFNLLGFRVHNTKQMTIKLKEFYDI